MKANKLRLLTPYLSMLFATSCAFQGQRAIPSRWEQNNQIVSLTRTMPAGTAQRAYLASQHKDYFASSARNLLDMLDIQGTSYVVKAPDSAQGSCYLNFAVHYFVNGKAVPEECPYPSDQVQESKLPSARSWLVDILVWPDWLSSKERGFAHAIRVTPLDSDKEWVCRGRSFFEYPEDVRSTVFPVFTLFQPLKRGVA